MRYSRHLLLAFFYLTITLLTARSIQIVDETGRPLPAAQICCTPAGNEISSDLKGQFNPSLLVGPVMYFSKSGYENLTLPYADLRAGDTIQLLLQAALLPEVKVGSAVAYHYPIFSTPQAARLTAPDIARLPVADGAEALEFVPGLLVQRSQQGGGSPNLRGFEANRILLVVDGVRLNNAIYRAGHLQNAMTVGGGLLERVDVLFGPGSLIYGSDALGGVVHFQTRDPELTSVASQKYRFMEARLRYSSPDRSLTYQAGFGYGGRRLTSLTYLTYRDRDDLRAGSNRPDRFPAFGRRNSLVVREDGRDRILANPDPDRQTGGGYRQVDVLQKLRYKIGSRQELALNFQYSTSSDIGRYDQLTQTRNGRLRWAEWHYGPQTRALASLKYSDQQKRLLWDYAHLQLAYQLTEEDRFSRRRDDPLREEDRVTVHDWQANWLARRNLRSGDLMLGADLRHDRVTAAAQLFDITTQQPVAPLDPRYPGAGSSLTAAGVFLKHSQPLGTRWWVETGLRYERQYLRARFGADKPTTWPAAYLDPGIRSEQGALVPSLSLRRQSPHFSWITRLAGGFRSPNLDDLVKFRENNGFIQVPNPDLKPERTWTLESSVNRTSGRFTYDLSGFATLLTDAVVRTDFTLPDGSSTLVRGGDTLLIQANVNADRAYLLGGTAALRWEPARNWLVGTDLTYTYGRRRAVDPRGGDLWVPQDHIPPLFGSTRLRYHAPNWSVELLSRFSAAKPLSEYSVIAIAVAPDGTLVFDRTGTSDNLEDTPVGPENGKFAGVYGWVTFGLYTQWSVNDHLSVTFSLENITDRHYRTFGSGISAAGRGVGLGVGYAL
ncbi:MAG: TonB-dependent receptor [Saprospiraceae bacterium]